TSPPSGPRPRPVNTHHIFESPAWKSGSSANASPWTIMALECRCMQRGVGTMGRSLTLHLPVGLHAGREKHRTLHRDLEESEFVAILRQRFRTLSGSPAGGDGSLLGNWFAFERRGSGVGDLRRWRDVAQHDLDLRGPAAVEFERRRGLHQWPVIRLFVSHLVAGVFQATIGDLDAPKDLVGGQRML